MAARWTATATALALAVAGCGGPAPATPPRPQPPAAEAASPAPSPRHRAAAGTTRAAVRPASTGDTTAGSGSAGLDGFVSAVRGRMPEVAEDRRDEELEQVATAACAALARGRTAGAVVAEARSLGTPDPAATDTATGRELVRLAIRHVCPAQSRRAGEFG
jgi:Protein of unknown function (DUF732)